MNAAGLRIGELDAGSVARWRRLSISVRKRPFFTAPAEVLRGARSAMTAIFSTLSRMVSCVACCRWVIFAAGCLAMR